VISRCRRVLAPARHSGADRPSDGPQMTLLGVQPTALTREGA
jgi:hypothetical protein